MEEFQSRLIQLAQTPPMFPLSVASPGDTLKVFISSNMVELYDVRELVAQTLNQRSIDAWIHEGRAGARPESVVETSLREAAVADVYVGLFWRNYGRVTVQEYRHARELNKPCFVYIRDRNCVREPELEAFLRSEVYDPHNGVNYDYFESALSIGQQVAGDIMAWLVRQHRKMTSDMAHILHCREEIIHLQAEVNRLQDINNQLSS